MSDGGIKRNHANKKLCFLHSLVRARVFSSAAAKNGRILRHRPGNRCRCSVIAIQIRIGSGHRGSARNGAGAQPHCALFADQRLCPRHARPRGRQRKTGSGAGHAGCARRRKPESRRLRQPSRKRRQRFRKRAEPIRRRWRCNRRPKLAQILPARPSSAIRSCLNPVPCRRRKWMRCERGAMPAAAELASRESMVAAAEERIKQVEARISQAKAQAGRADVLMSWTQIKAPAAGKIVERSADTGTAIFPGNAADGDRIHSQAPGSRGSSNGTCSTVCKSGMKCASETLGNRRQSSKAGLRKSFRYPIPRLTAFSSKWISRRMFRMPNGQFVKVEVPVGTRNALLVPRQAIRETGQLTGLFVVDSASKARFRLVKSGRPMMRNTPKSCPASNPAKDILAGLNNADHRRDPRGDQAMSKPQMAGKLAHAFIHSKLTPLILVASISLGVAAVVHASPRRGASDHRSDDRCHGFFPGRLGQGSGNTHHQTHGAAALGNPRRRIYLHAPPAPASCMAIVRFYVGRMRKKASSG